MKRKIRDLPPGKQHPRTMKGEIHEFPPGNKHGAVSEILNLRTENNNLKPLDLRRWNDPEFLSSRIIHITNLTNPKNLVTGVLRNLVTGVQGISKPINTHRLGVMFPP
jgi:hypothetical protein